jgi:hypothetical protein
MDGLFYGDLSQDSIFSADDEEEVEVNNLLASDSDE